MSAPDWSSFDDAQLLALEHGLDIASMEVGLGDEAYLLYYQLLEECARRDLEDEGWRGSQVDWVVDHLHPPHRERVFDVAPPLDRRLPHVHISMVSRDEPGA